MLAFNKLRAFLSVEKSEAQNEKYFSTTRLFDEAGDISSVELSRVLAKLVRDGLVEQIVRVEPAYGEGIGDFSSIEEIPLELEDWRHPGSTVEVRPEYLQVYYKLTPTTANGN
jgi:hypothetical protein